MPKDLDDKVALVTGGGRGLGRAFSRALADRGASVLIGFVRNRAAAEEMAAEISDAGGRAEVVKANVKERAGVERLFDCVRSSFGRLDVFISNAASGVNRPIAELDERAWDWTMDTNARSLFLAAAHLVDLMDKGGSVLTVSSPGSGKVLPDYSMVGISKAALEALVRYLAVELAPNGIRVNAVSPGVVETDALKAFPSSDSMRAWQQNAPIPRLIRPDDVAKAAMFLTSDAAAMITGQVLTIDGGAGLRAYPGPKQ